MAHLVASLWRVQPRAMGLIPSPRLDAAIRNALKKCDIMKSGVSSQIRMLMNIDKNLSNCLPHSPNPSPSHRSGAVGKDHLCHKMNYFEKI